MSRCDGSTADWGIVGAGMLGLTLAHRLAKRGERVVVFDSAPQIGGLAAAWQIGDLSWDTFYHVTLLSDLRLRELLAELALDDEIEWVETRTGFFTDGRFHSMSNSWEFLRFPPLRLIDKLRLGMTIFAAAKRRDWRPLESVLVGDWLRRWSGRRTFEKIWRPLLLAKLGEAYQRTSAVFIWATIARMYGARQAGLKKEMFGYVRGGYARVLTRFAEKLASLGVEFQLGRPVNRVTGDEAGAVVETTTDACRVDHVILTTPGPHIVAACPQLPDEQRRRHESIEYLGVICASVVLARPLAGYYVTNVTDEGYPFTAVIEMSALVAPSLFGGRSLAYLPRYVSQDDPAWGWSDQEVQDRFLAGLRRMYPDLTDEQVLAVRVARARHVMGLPTLNYSSRLPDLATGIPQVFAVNSSQIVKGTLNVNEIITLADQSLETIDQFLTSSVSLISSTPCTSQAVR